MKRNRVEGINGSAGVNTTIGEQKQWVNPFVNIGMHTEKWTFNINGNINGSPSDRHTTHEESANSINSQRLDGISHHKSRAMQGGIVAGAFYEPTASDKIGIQVDYNIDKSRHTSDSQTNFSSDMQTNGSYVAQNRYHNLNATLNWSHQLDDKGSSLKWISNYNYQDSRVDDNNVMAWSDALRDSVYKTDNSNRYNIFVTELALRKVLKNKWSFNAGAKYTRNDVAYRSIHSYMDGMDWVGNRGYDYDDSYEENIVALYATTTGEVGRWKFKAGLRGEYFTTNGYSVGGSRFDLFPNANISFDITERGDYTASVGYYRNIMRPSFWSLNPVVSQVSDYSYTVGNPNLTPSYTDAVSLDFVLAGKFTVAAGWSQTSNPIRQMFKTNSEYPDRMYLTWDNDGKDRNAFIHADGFLNITKWWNLYSSVTYVVSSQKREENGGFDTFSYIQLVASTTFLLPKGFDMALSCFYNSKMKVGNISVYPILNLNPTIQKRFGRNWSASVGLENMLQRKGKIRTSSAGYDRTTYTKNYMAVKVGVTYSFNSGKDFRSERIENNSDSSRLSKEY